MDREREGLGGRSRGRRSWERGGGVEGGDIGEGEGRDLGRGRGKWSAEAGGIKAMQIKREGTGRKENKKRVWIKRDGLRGRSREKGRIEVWHWGGGGRRRMGKRSRERGTVLERGGGRGGEEEEGIFRERGERVGLMGEDREEKPVRPPHSKGIVLGPMVAPAR